MTKGTIIRYDTGTSTVEAIVLTIHRDKSITVEPRFFVVDGKRLPGCIGGKVRLDAADYHTP